jgi:ADP-ribose pyrophosphatase YjhB (NUDIX family)
MDPQLIRILERVIAISQTGLTYTDGVFDRERYESLRELVGEILERVDANPPPLQVAFPKEEGYRTPKLDVRGLVLRDGKVLLVRERADGCWALPGGWADVGISASANIEKEISEESGLVTRAVRLLALLDRDKHAHDASPWHTYKAFFQCEIVGGTLQHTLETDGAEFFDLAALPPLSVPRITEDQIRRICALSLDQTAQTWFD